MIYKERVFTLKEFKNKIYKCFSPQMRDFLLENNVLPIGEEDKVWCREERIKYLESHGIPYDGDKICDLERKCWLYETSDYLSELLTMWSNNKPRY